MTRSFDPQPAFAALLYEPGVSATWRALLAVPEPNIRFGFPCLLSGVRSALVRERCTLTFSAQVGGRAFLVLVPTPTVQALSERMLGGEGRFADRALASAALPAELGCLAYLAARLLAPMGGSFQLADANLDSERLRRCPDASVCLPVQVTSELGTFTLELVAEPDVWSDERLLTRLSVDERDLPSEPLALGDMVLLEGGPTILSGGPSGVGVVRTRGLIGEATVRFEAGRVSGTGIRPQRTAGAELTLDERALTLSDLACIGSGELAWPIDGARGSLSIAGAVRARGELVRLRGALGLRITELVVD